MIGSAVELLHDIGYFLLDMPKTNSHLSTNELRDRVSCLPRFPLAHLPTPLEYLPRFSRAVGGPDVYIKRDDCTGLAFGGNKTRHNEFLLADAIEKGADMFVWGASVQSNNCRQTAASCAKAGLDCHLVLGRGKTADGPEPVQGNLLLDHLVGASIEIIEESVGPAVDKRIAQAAARFRERGRKPYEWDRHRLRPLAAVGYVLCLVEILEQATQAGIAPDAIYVCSAGSTGSGLSLGGAALGQSFPIWHVTPIVWPWDTPTDMAGIASEAAQLIGVDICFEPDQLNVTQDYVGQEYGEATPGCLEAISLLARTEGILLDPVYTGKAMAGLIDHIRNGQFTRDQKVIFVHTGGTPALFAYNEVLANRIESRQL